jgi:hypothetical protein
MVDEYIFFKSIFLYFKSLNNLSLKKIQDMLKDYFIFYVYKIYLQSNK